MTRYKIPRRIFTVFTILCIAIFLHMRRNEPKDLLSPLPKAHYLNVGVDAQSARLQASAQNRADCLSLESCLWGHEGWEESIRSQVPNLIRGGEVLGRDWESWDRVILEWRSSEPHAEVLSGDWCEYGLASSSAGTKTVYVGHFACD